MQTTIQQPPKGKRHDNGKRFFSHGTDPDTMAYNTDKFGDPSTWPNTPIYFCAAPSMKQDKDDRNLDGPLPLGQVVPFCTNLFHGRILFRIRDLPAKSDQERHEAYFANRKRLYQVIIQGKFLTDKTINFSDLFIGARYEKPFDGIPMRKSRIMRCIQSFVQSINPGMLFDIGAEKPRVMVPLGTCQRLTVDHEGEEPDILECSKGIEENTHLLFEQNTARDEKPFRSTDDRRSRMANPKCSSKFIVDPSLMYTIEIYDDLIDFAQYKQNFGRFVKVDLSKKLNGQPLTLTALLVPHNNEAGDDRYKDEEVLYDFQVWHEKVLQKLISLNEIGAMDKTSHSDSDVTTSEEIGEES